MNTNTLKALEQARATVSKLESKMMSELAELPAQYGFGSMDAFVSALQSAGGSGPAPARAATRSPKAPRARKRAKVTDETRAQVKKLVEAGKTGAEIAKEVGVSLPTVQNIKKALGLVRK